MKLNLILYAASLAVLAGCNTTTVQRAETT